MGVPRGTTPTFTLTIDDETIDLTQADAVYVTFSDANQTITKTGTDLTVAARQIDVSFTQEETLAFGSGKGAVDIQVNWTYPSGARCATNLVSYNLFTRQLINEVL